MKRLLLVDPVFTVEIQPGFKPRSSEQTVLMILSSTPMLERQRLDEIASHWHPG